MVISLKKKIALYFILCIFMLVTVMPLVWLAIMSFKSNEEIIAGNIMALPKVPYTENYVEAWITGRVGKYFFNSVIVTFISLVLTLIFGVPMAYGVSRMRWKLSRPTLTLLMAGIMIPIHATLIPVFFILKNLKLLDSYFSLILPYVASTLPITVYIVKNFMISIPYEMEEAAYIDGCGTIRAFLCIIVPTIKQSLMVVITLNFLTFWNEYVMASTLVTDPTKYTLPIGLRVFSSDYAVNYGAIAAGVFISMLPVLIMYLLFTDFLEKGMIAGAIK